MGRHALSALPGDMRVLIGYDIAEHSAAMVAARSLRDVTDGELNAEFLDVDKLVSQGLLWRPVDRRGQRYDLISGAPASTDFAASRFLTPIICQTGFALFVDCDVVFMQDPRDMLREAVTGKAVYVVKHDHQPTERLKMVNQEQTSYPRKNWSSVMLFDCDHPANRRLSLHDVSSRPGRDLHAFYWLNDSETGMLGAKWNWLVDIEPRPPQIGIAHMTLGGPWLPGWTGGGFDSEWHVASGRM